MRDPYSFAPTLGEIDLYLAGEGRHEELYEKLGAHVTEIDGATGRGLRRVGAVGALGLGRRRLQLVGRAPAPDALARRLGHLGAVHPRRARGLALQVRAARPGRRPAAARRPVRLRGRAAAQDGVGRQPHALRVDRRRLDGAARAGRPAARADVDLRGPPRLLAAEPAGGQPLADLPRAGRRAGRLRHRHGLHPRRADAGHGPPVQRLVGLPGHLVLRAHAALRHARPVPRLRRPPARGRRRRDPRLGARALPARRVGARALRRQRAVRARRSAPRLAPRLGHADLQLRPPRGAQLPAGQRPVLAARVPHRRHPGRRRGLDALPRLLAQGGPVGPQRVRRARGPRGGRPSSRSSTRSPTAASRGSSPPPRSPPRGRASRGRPTSAAWASASSGTWAGCTTRWATSSRTRSTAATTTTS